jgi:hypothetical protein
MRYPGAESTEARGAKGSCITGQAGAIKAASFWIVSQVAKSRITSDRAMPTCVRPSRISYVSTVNVSRILQTDTVLWSCPCFAEITIIL